MRLIAVLLLAALPAGALAQNSAMSSKGGAAGSERAQTRVAEAALVCCIDSFGNGCSGPDSDTCGGFGCTYRMITPKQCKDFATGVTCPVSHCEEK